jgi:dihydrofolate reductase
MEITLIAACAEKNGVIGANGSLPWHIPSDLKRFKEYTKNKIVIMGRTTFESLPVFLHGRISVVLTSDYSKVQAKVDNLKTKFSEASPIIIMNSIEELIDSLDQIIEYAQAKLLDLDRSEMVVIGGESVYTEFLPVASKMVLSLVKGEIYGDKFFPRFDREVWKKTSIDRDATEEGDDHEYSVLVLECSDSNVVKFPSGDKVSKLETYKMLKR